MLIQLQYFQLHDNKANQTHYNMLHAIFMISYE
jgi:hypothetical protein